MNKILKRILQFGRRPGRRPARRAVKDRRGKTTTGQYGVYGSE